jgi:hypothetical protein
VNGSVAVAIAAGGDWNPVVRTAVLLKTSFCMLIFRCESLNVQIRNVRASKSFQFQYRALVNLR